MATTVSVTAGFKAVRVTVRSDGADPEVQTVEPNKSANVILAGTRTIEVRELENSER